MEIKPEAYLDVSALEMVGPNAYRQQQQAIQSQAEPSSSTSPDAELHALQQQLHQAQRTGDTSQIERLSHQLDSQLAALHQPSQIDPQAPSKASPVQSTQEELNARYTASEVHSELKGKHGVDEVNRVHSWANDNLTEDELGAYLGLIGSDDPEALLAFESLKQMASDESLAPDPDGVEYASFDESQASALVERYGDHGEIMVNLNRQYLAGQITEQQMQRAVLSDPSLAMSVFSAKAQGLISY